MWEVISMHGTQATITVIRCEEWQAQGSRRAYLLPEVMDTMTFAMKIRKLVTIAGEKQEVMVAASAAWQRMNRRTNVHRAQLGGEIVSSLLLGCGGRTRAERQSMGSEEAKAVPAWRTAHVRHETPALERQQLCTGAWGPAGCHRTERAADRSCLLRGADATGCLLLDVGLQRMSSSGTDGLCQCTGTAACVVAVETSCATKSTTPGIRWLLSVGGAGF
jgi:hypothetical protein